MNESWQIVFQLVLAVAGSTVVGQAVQAISGRRKVNQEAIKLNAEASVELSDAALAQLKEVKIDLDETKASVRAFKKALHEHETWDRMVLRELYVLGRTDIPNPPELWI